MKFTRVPAVCTPSGVVRLAKLQSERVATLCRAVCTQVAIELDSDVHVAPSERLVPAMHR